MSTPLKNTSAASLKVCPSSPRLDSVPTLAKTPTNLAASSMLRPDTLLRLDSDFSTRTSATEKSLATSFAPNVLSKRDAQQIFRAERELHTREQSRPIVLAYSSLAIGGKLLAAIGATYLGNAISSHERSDWLLGAALSAGGIAGAITAAALCFGRHARATYPQYVTTLKGVAYSGTGLLVAGGLIGQLGINHKELPLIAAGWTMSALGAGLVSVSFRNFVAMCELDAGRLFTQNRQGSAQAMGAVGAGGLAAFATFGHQVEMPSAVRSTLHAALLAAVVGSYAISSSEALRERVRSASEQASTEQLDSRLELGLGAAPLTVARRRSLP